MININFDNPYLLLLIIPFAALVLVPYFIAIRKENKSISSTVALVTHLVIVVLVILAAAGMSNVNVITETEVFVVADLSYSTYDSMDLIDEYIADIEDNLPENSKMGVVTFGKNYRLHTPLGAEITSVKESLINRSTTDLVSALKYTSTCFSDDAIKRIVILTDGMFTDPAATGTLARTIADLKANDIYVDAIYISSELAEDAKEIQLSSVDFKESCNIGAETTADVLVESTFDTNIILTLSKDGIPVRQKPVTLTTGYNIINFELDTEVAGEYDYELTFTSRDDTSPNNNVLRFTQSVHDGLKILLVTGNKSDVNVVRDLYGDRAEIKSCVQPAQSAPGSFQTPFYVPVTVEELCYYDEIIISNVDIRTISNCDSFVSSLDTVVSLFGKTLITVGNNQIQNKDSESLKAFEDILPVRFGNSDSDPKLYTLVIDCSRSMVYERAFYFEVAKKAAEHVVNMLGENDSFSIVTFSGEVYTLVQPPLKATPENKEMAVKALRTLDVEQGTMIGSALEAAYTFMSGLSYDEKNIMLISDGMSFTGGSAFSDDPIETAKKLKANNIIVSTLKPGDTEDTKQGKALLTNIANAGGGKFFLCPSLEELDDIMFNEVADDINHTEIIGRAEISIDREHDRVLEGVDSLSSITGYVYAKKKASADTVLSTVYTKASGGKVEVPIYASWSYGTGRVATLTTTLGGEWVNGWKSGSGLTFLKNIVLTNIPEQRTDHPYTVNVEYDGRYSYIEIIPAVVNPDATMNVSVVFPDGSEASELLTFESNRYFMKAETGTVGKYRIKTSYNWHTKSYFSESVYTISYSPEYDSFKVSSPAPLYAMMRDNGGVYENSDVDLTVEQGKIATYIVRFTVPFLAAASILYVIDTIIRKLQWADIVSLFKKKKKGGRKMKRPIILILILSILISLTSCSEYNPAEESKEPVNDEIPGDNNEPDSPPADGEYTFTATVMLGGNVYIPEMQNDPEKALKVRWTDGTKYYTVPVGYDGKAVCEGLDGEYSVTLVNLPGEYTYNPNIYRSDNDSRDVVIELLTLSEGHGEGTGEFNCIEMNNPGVYRAVISQQDQIVYFQFTPSRSGVYVVESIMDVSAGMYNPVMRMYNGSSQFKYPDEVIDGGGISGSYTTNFQKTIIVPSDSFVGNSYTFDVYVEGRDAVYPVNLDFTITYKGAYDYSVNEKHFMLPSYIPKDDYDDWYEEYCAYLMADREKFGNVYRDASVSIGGKNVFSSQNYRLSSKDGMHLNSIGQMEYDPFDPKDEFYHVYNTDKYPTTGGWGPILYAAISVPTRPTVPKADGTASDPFIDRAFSTMELAGNNALSLGENATDNYKIFIEGYYNILNAAGNGNPGDRVSNYYFCVEECPCIATNGGACAIEDGCTKCDKNCRNIPRAAIGQRGYADIAIDGMCPVTLELQEFLQKYCIVAHIFKDGNGMAETHDPGYDADHASMWLFACGYYD